MAERTGHGRQKTQQRTLHRQRQTRNRPKRKRQTNRLPSQIRRHPRPDCGDEEVGEIRSQNQQNSIKPSLKRLGFVV